MKANELRIGNYVHMDMSIDDIEVVRLKIGDLALFAIEARELYRIPLTEARLLKFGFEWKGLISKGRYLTIFTPCGKALVFKDNYFIFAGVTIETQIQYVHQLQNLYFVLTGEELKLKEDERETD
jgi:hypothetical protein